MGDPLSALAGRGGQRLIASVLQPYHFPRRGPRRKPRAGEVEFPTGLKLSGEFLRENDLLQTACDDFAEFFRQQELGGQSATPCVVERADGFESEEHEVAVGAGKVVLRSGDTEGIRRAIYWVEDEMLKRSGPFLPTGIHRRKAKIQTRISRCFFGPINRPPQNRDELNDEINYYPDAYLNRLAHDGVNALWITIKFRDSVPSKIFPDFARDGEKRLAKLRETVRRCARFGIRIFVFCIEPDSLPVDSPLFRKYPGLKGHVIEDRAAFCAGSGLGRRYLTEATRTLFGRVPGLGGMIVIPVGERFTHCYSIALPESGTTEERCNCPRCASRRPEEVLHDVLSAMREGMVAANPRAELIAWPYGQLIMWGEKMTVAAAGRLPEGVILQHNFETGGTVRQLGKDRLLWDYWLSVVGASPAFRKTARAALAKGNRVSAKLQVGCSHEDATVPFVPVPGLLHSKYALLHKLGVSAVMQSWYFGNTPSLMTRAAGLLSFSPIAKDENAFLEELALRDWGPAAPRVVKAWKLFRRAYENYPATHLFGYYGPVQDGLVWPLHLLPRNLPLAPTWKLGYPPSGDYLADCLSSHFTLAEVVTLCGRMSRLWQQGMKALDAAMPCAEKTPQQMTEWRVAGAINLQFCSAAEILKFYSLRERLVQRRGQTARRILQKMEDVVRGEIARRHAMLELCRQEPSLGFHSEAEGFKITPALLRKGMRSLERLLERDFPAVRDSIDGGGVLFPHYTGEGARSVFCIPKFSSRSGSLPSHRLSNILFQRADLVKRSAIRGTGWMRGKTAECPWKATFRAARLEKSLKLAVRVDEVPVPAQREGTWHFTVVLDIEPRRLHPRVQFIGDSRGFRTSIVDDGYLMTKPVAFGWRWRGDASGGSADMDVLLSDALLKGNQNLFRWNLRVVAFHPETNDRWELSWTRRSPLLPRQAWDDANPATDYGWAKLGTTKIDAP
jgi:hypothetical protein